MNRQDRSEAVRRQAENLPQGTDWRSRKRRREAAARLYRQAWRLRRPAPTDWGDDLPF